MGDEIRSLLNDDALQRIAGDRGGLVMLRDAYFQNQLVIVAMAPEPNPAGQHAQPEGRRGGRLLQASIVRRQLADIDAPGVAHPGRRGFALALPPASTTCPVGLVGFRVSTGAATTPRGRPWA